VVSDVQITNQTSVLDNKSFAKHLAAKSQIKYKITVIIQLRSFKTFKI